MKLSITPTIKAKLLLSFAAVAVIGSIANIIGYRGISELNRDILTIEQAAGLSASVQDAAIGNLLLRRYEKDFILSIGDAEKQKSYQEKFNNTVISLEKTLFNIVKCSDSGISLPDSVSIAIKENRKNFDAYVTGMQTVFKALSDNPALTSQEANKLISSFKEATHALEKNTEIISSGTEALISGTIHYSVNQSNASRILMLVAMILAIAAAVLLGTFISQALSRPIRKITAFIKDLSGGDLTKQITIPSRDEIGQMAGSLNHFITVLNGSIKNISTDAETFAGSSSDLAVISTQIAQSSEEMSSMSTVVAAATEQSTANISNISSAAERMSLDVTNVATAIEEMSVTANEIAKNCHQETQIVDTATSHAQSTRELMNRFEASSRDIGKIADVISAIADKTNLLALNATIEAASAGEAGRGFAVVAGEVKELAKQTAEATQQISGQIQGMQLTTRKAAEAITAITTTIEKINTISHTIVGAVEEQSATINEIAKNVDHARGAAADIAKNVSESAKGLTEVSSNIQGVSTGASQTTSGINTVKMSAQSLFELAKGLETVVKQFKV